MGGSGELHRLPRRYRATDVEAVERPERAPLTDVVVVTRA